MEYTLAEQRELLPFPIRGMVFAIHLWHRQPVFGCQGLGQRLLHNAFQCGQTVKIVSQAVVFHQSPIFRLEQVNDGEIAIIDEFGSVKHFSTMLFVSLTFVLNNICWNA